MPWPRLPAAGPRGFLPGSYDSPDEVDSECGATLRRRTPCRFHSKVESLLATCGRRSSGRSIRADSCCEAEYEGFDESDAVTPPASLPDERKERPAGARAAHQHDPEPGERMERPAGARPRRSRRYLDAFGVSAPFRRPCPPA